MLSEVNLSSKFAYLLTINTVSAVLVFSFAFFYKTIFFAYNFT